MAWITPSGSVPSPGEGHGRPRQRATFDDFLARLPKNDRANANRRMAARAAGSDDPHVALWRQLVCTLTTLAPHASSFRGRTAQFYVADGAYRRQVFALDDLPDGTMAVACPDVLHEAVNTGILAPKTAPGLGELYAVGGGEDSLRVEVLDGRAGGAEPQYAGMLGWNRKALRVFLPASPSSAQVAAVERLCELASLGW